MTEDKDQETYHGYSVDDEDQPQSTDDSLAEDRGLDEPLDEGFSPKESWSAGQGYGSTPLEEARGESFEQRLPQEIGEPDPYDGAEQMSIEDLEGEAEDEPAEVGDRRAGRLVDPDEGARDDDESELLGTDVGIDGAAAGAEEAAVHLIEDED